MLQTCNKTETVTTLCSTKTTNWNPTPKEVLLRIGDLLRQFEEFESRPKELQEKIENFAQNQPRQAAPEILELQRKIQEILDRTDTQERTLSQILIALKECLLSLQTQKSSAKKPKSSVVPANEKRDSRIFELRKAEKPFAEVCDIINQDFPGELLDEKGASEALKRHCTRNKIPYPYGKRGRKTH